MQSIARRCQVQLHFYVQYVLPISVGIPPGTGDLSRVRTPSRLGAERKFRGS